MNHKKCRNLLFESKFLHLVVFISMIAFLQCIPFLSAARSAYSCLYDDMWYLRVKLIHQLLYGMIV